MTRFQEVIEANEELKAKIKGKEGEIQQLRTSYDKDAEELSKDWLILSIFNKSEDLSPD